jgi:hypothetical protein
LVGVILDVNTLDFGSAIITVRDTKGLAALLTLDTLALIAAGDKFSSTTTGEADDETMTTGASHGLSAGDVIIITAATGGGTGAFTVGVKYYVKTTGLTANTFILSDTDAVGHDEAAHAFGTDYSAMSWYKVGSSTGVARLYRPSTVVTSSVGVAVTAAAEAPNVNRDIMLGGKVGVVCAEGGNLGAGVLVLIVDETGLGDPAVTV